METSNLDVPIWESVTNIAKWNNCTQEVYLYYEKSYLELKKIKRFFILEFFGGCKINIMTLDNLKNWIASGNHSEEISKLIDRRIVVNAFLNALEKINLILKKKNYRKFIRRN